MGSRYADKKIVVVGAGKSGLALCRFLSGQAAHVVLSDKRSLEMIDAGDELLQLPIELDLGGHTAGLFHSADLVVLSPGVPLEIEPVQAALAAGVPVIGEIEVAVREIDAGMIGITGTNGKSTVTALVGEIFQGAGCKTFVGGNIGEPLTGAIEVGNWNWLVIELSSFQLETMESFRPKYSMLLNISEDHLDRYASMADYVAAKKRIFANQAATDYMILNADDPQVLEAASGAEATPIYFSCQKELDAGMSLDNGEIVWRWQEQGNRFPLSELKLKGLHNIANVMAAMIPALIEGYEAADVWRVVTGFSGLEHRMNLVRTLDGVDWYNDSKGTNVGSVLMSLAGLDAPVTLIAGGKDKGGDYAILRETIGAKVAHLILIGEAADRMEEEIGAVTEVHRCASLEEAVARAQRVTRPGGAVLLSPGCSSFDMFSNFAVRGERFCQLVMDLGSEQGVINGTA